MSETLLTIILIVISIIGSVITGVLIPYLKSKMKQEDLRTMNFWVETAMYAAEQRWKETSKGFDKKQFVRMFLREKIPELSDSQIEILIEGTGKALGIFKKVVE